MNKLTTVEKGDKLENQIFELFQEILSDGSYYLNNKTSKVYLKKGYYSPKREKDIIIDVSIETFIEGATEFSLLTLIECKNLNKSVSVDDVEEFSKKISQIGEHNTKGIIVTKIGFQESAFKVAKAERIGLARISDSERLKWISYRKDEERVLSERDFISNNSTHFPFLSLNDGKVSENIADLLIALSVIDKFTDKEDFVFVPYVDDKRISYIVDKLSKYDIYDEHLLNFEKLIKLMTEKYGVLFEFDTVDTSNYLGKIEFNPLFIKISNKARVDNNRWRFTLAHELGHLILHSKLLENRIINKTDSEETLSIKYFNYKKNISRMELQANLFASTLLLPDKLLFHQVQLLFNEYNIRRGRMYLDEQPINQHEVYKILYKLSSIFQVSIEALKIRLIKLNLLIDDTDKRLSTLLRKYIRG